MKDWNYHCSVLGLHTSASTQDVRRAYRRLALELHPDKHNNSTRSKEDFQRLHDSYQFLLDGLESGAHSAKANATTPRAAPTAQTSTPATGLAAWKMWLHAVAVASAIFTASIGWELSQKSAAPRAGRGIATQDLAAHSWCQISKSGVENAREVFDYWTETRCQQKCEKLAKAGNVECSWGSVAFHGIPPRAQAAQVSCDVVVEREAGQFVSTKYQPQTESRCEITCRSLASLEPRVGYVCLAGGHEVFRRDRYVALVEHEARAQPPPMARENELPEPDEASLGLARTCYLTALSTGDLIAETYPADTPQGCIARCESIVIAHPLEYEVHCSISGRPVFTYVPDSTAAYLRRSAKEKATGARQGAP